MRNNLEERMKMNYENRYRFYLPRRTFTILRLDGKCFSNYTSGLDKPFDHNLSSDIDSAVIDILPEIQGAAFALCQSDEISILLTDFEKPGTETWFSGNIQKMASVSASLLTASFAKYRIKRQGEAYFDKCKKVNGFNFDAYWEEFLQLNSLDEQIGVFDSRVFIIPDRTEVMNYFICRQNDCYKNSISMLAQSHFSHKELYKKSSSDKIYMLKEKGVEWDNYREDIKFGRIISREYYFASANPDSERSRWVSKPAWNFTKNDRLLNTIPQYT